MSFHDFIERAWAYGVRPSSRRKITAQQMYPWAVERQLQADLKAEFVKAGMYYKEQALKGTQSFKDNADDLADAQYDNDERIRPLAERVAYEVEKFQQASFENFSEVVIGERYVPAVVGPSITDTWQENFLTLCRSTNDDLKRRVSAIISDAVMNGNNIADTARQIDEAVGHYSYSKAMTIARTETGKLNMAISKAQMEEAGIDKYEWSCMMDERSRPSHEKMDGKICIWSNPNVVYNIKTKKTEPRPQSAVHLHPGDDYNCRCVALPWDELIEEELNQKKGKPNKQWLELKEQEKQKAAEKRAEREEIKRNKELVPQLTAENEKLQKQLKTLQQKIDLQNLEIEGLEQSIDDIEGTKKFFVFVTNDEGQKFKFVKSAENMQDAKHAVYMELKENPSKYGTNPIIPKFDEQRYQQKIKKATRVELPSDTETLAMSDKEAKEIVENKTTQMAERLGLTRSSNSPTYEDINPNREKYDNDGTHGNCQNCVAAVWWSDHGYNAIACPKTKRWNPQNINDIWIDPKTGRNPERHYFHNLKELEQATLRLPEGGQLQIYIFNSNPDAPGHTLIVQKYNGKAIIRDGQPENPDFLTFDEYNYAHSTPEAQMEKKYNGFRDWAFEKDLYTAQYWRIDNCYPSEEQLSGVIMPSKKK